MQLSLHYGQVIDNNDPDEKSKIKIRVLPEMKDMDEDKLPWVRPFLSVGMSSNQFSHLIPENDSNVWVVFIDKYYKEGYYVSGSFIDGFFDFDSVKSDLDNVSELSDNAYENIRFQRFPDGTVTFHNDSTGEIGIYHSSGKYVVLDQNGDITVEADNVTFTGDHTTEGNTTIEGTLDVGSATSSLTLYTGLAAAMSSLLLILAAHIHPVPLFGTVGPSPSCSSLSNSSIGLDQAESEDSASS